MKKCFIFTITITVLAAVIVLGQPDNDGCTSYDLKKGFISISSLPASSSFSEDKKDPFKYSPEKAFDGKLVTSWVEGRKNDGIGESIAFQVNKIRKLQVLPGVGDARYFKKNNRLKKATFTLHKLLDFGAAQCGVETSFDPNPLYRTILNFKDQMKIQSFEIDFKAKSSSKVNDHGYVAIIIIKEVYRGTHWRDTCISEIKVTE